MNLKSFHPSSFAIGIVCGAVFIGLWVFGGQLVPAPMPSSPLATSTDSAAFPPESGAVAVSDQAAGNTVMVDSVTVPPPGVWVAVRETGMGNELGNVLGAARVRGPGAMIPIALLRPTLSGQVYAIELYRAEDDAAFSADTGSVYVDFDTGQRVVALFTAK